MAFSLAIRIRWRALLTARVGGHGGALANASACTLGVFALRHQPVSPSISSCGARDRAERERHAGRRPPEAPSSFGCYATRTRRGTNPFVGGAKRGAQRPAGGPPEASSDRPQLGWLPSRRQAPSNRAQPAAVVSVGASKPPARLPVARPPARLSRKPPSGRRLCFLYRQAGCLFRKPPARLLGPRRIGASAQSTLWPSRLGAPRRM